MSPRLLILLLSTLFLSRTLRAQNRPEVNIHFSNLLATYDFVQQLSADRPDNRYKQLFAGSAYNRSPYRELIQQMDTIRLYESYAYQDYPTGQKIPGITTAFIERNLIHATSLTGFKQQSFGIVPNEELFGLCRILSAFLPVYDSLIYQPNRKAFEEKLNALSAFVGKANLAHFFETGLRFYHTEWDQDISFDIAVIPSVNEEGFSARAFLNNAVSEVPLNFDNNEVLFSVLLHEIYHILYDGQSLRLKQDMAAWFGENRSMGSQYASLLLNEALATALGNGYVYEQLNGAADTTDWYNVRYINLMARRLYPVLKSYIAEHKAIDQDFVDQYVALYDTSWTRELDHLFKNRYVMADSKEVLQYFIQQYPHASMYESVTPVNADNLSRMQQTPITKIVVVSSDRIAKLQAVHKAFPELKQWQYDARKDFVYTTMLKDKTRLFVINCVRETAGSLLEQYYPKGRIE
ncbi:hypothetical protein [Taibaiella koreensis]|uniref:hypothetical protein n=1 Tax=Taibaiella koreensis TaxID=1268548 RepID=UPI000E59FAA6|nr:hypothetical protein [Taibaiella koreensis]